MKILAVHYNFIFKSKNNCLGSKLNERNLTNHLQRCKRYIKQNDINTCSNEFLDNYCPGKTIESVQWPPTLTSHSSQTLGRNINRLFYLGFTISYVYVPCAKKSKIKAVETIISTTQAQATDGSKSYFNNYFIYRIHLCVNQHLEL